MLPVRDNACFVCAFVQRPWRRLMELERIRISWSYKREPIRDQFLSKFLLRSIHGREGGAPVEPESSSNTSARVNILQSRDSPGIRTHEHHPIIRRMCHYIGSWCGIWLIVTVRPCIDPLSKSRSHNVSLREGQILSVHDHSWNSLLHISTPVLQLPLAPTGSLNQNLSRDTHQGTQTSFVLWALEKKTSEP